MGLLDGEIKKAIAAGFKGKLLTGTLRRVAYGNLDSKGDPAVTSADYTFEGFRDNFTAFYAAQAGIPVTDARILIIAGSILVAPKKDDKVLISGEWYQLRRVVEVDPAGATYTMAGFSIEAP